MSIEYVLDEAWLWDQALWYRRRRSRDAGEKDMLWCMVCWIGYASPLSGDLWPDKKWYLRAIRAMKSKYGKA